jgi:hypothetical protein
MLPTSPILASLVIIGWLLFTPSAWRRYIDHIDPHLSPNFALAHLTKQHWQQPALWRLLILGHGLTPLWVSFMVIGCLWLLDTPNEAILLATCYALPLSLVGGILGSFMVSVAFGIITGMIGGILLSLPVGISGEILFSMAKNLAIAIMLIVNFSDSAITTSENLLALATVWLGIFTASLGGSIMYSTTKTAYNYPAYRQMGSIVIGVVVSSVVVFLIIGFTALAAHSVTVLIKNGILFTLAYDTLINGVFGLSIAFIWFLPTWHWQSALLFGLAASFLLGLFTLLKNQFFTFLPLQMPLYGLHGGIENAFLYLLLFAFPYVFAERIANPWAGIIAGVFGSCGVFIAFTLFTQGDTWWLLLLLMLLAILLGLSFVWWRPLLFYPFQSAWNLLLYHAEEKRLDRQTSLLSWHTAFWDEHQHLPLFGLETYLVMVTERNPGVGKAAIEYLSNSSQNWAAQEAQIELDARRLQSYADVTAISQAHRQLAAGELSSPVSALLRSFSRISRDIEAGLAQESSYNQRLALDAVEERLDGLLRELTRSSEQYAQRFYPIAAQWRQTVADYVRALGEAVESRQEISNPYIIGIPLTEHQEIFVGRSDVSARIERLLLDVRCPPLLLYGQRRTGKTSLLNNLGKLLPWQIIPLFVDLQGPTSLAKDYAGFLYNISRAMLTSAKRHRELQLPPLSREQLHTDPFTRFDEWLDEIEQILDSQQTLLLTLDEFSALEHIFNKGFLDEASVLGMFRHLIQHRPRIKILLSGSHTIDEFERWASYLINVQTVHISYLQTNEALQLIEHPVKDFALRYAPDASQRVMTITHCHPALIQLLCAEIVTIKNKQDIIKRRFAQVTDVEEAIAGALQHGRFFFADIAHNQVTKTGLILLRLLAQQGEGAIVSQADLIKDSQLAEPAGELALTHLLQRELIESVGNNKYCFQVELIRRWFI